MVLILLKRQQLLRVVDCVQAVTRGTNNNNTVIMRTCFKNTKSNKQQNSCKTLVFQRTRKLWYKIMNLKKSRNRIDAG